jgi:lactate permease
VLLVVVVLWTGPWSHLPGKSLFKVSEVAISSISHKPTPSTFNFNYLSGGTSIFASWIVIVLLLRPSLRTLKEVFARTFHQMWGAFLVALFMFGLAYVFVFSGMASSLGYGLS